MKSDHVIMPDDAIITATDKALPYRNAPERMRRAEKGRAACPTTAMEYNKLMGNSGTTGRHFRDGVIAVNGLIMEQCSTTSYADR